MWDEEIIVGALPKGITRANEPVLKRNWNFLGSTYTMKGISESAFVFESCSTPGTGVPMHVHPTQDEFIYVRDGVISLHLDGEWETAGPGDVLRLPRDIPHAYYNKSESFANLLFWVAPAGKLATLFDKLHEMDTQGNDDPAEFVRISALYDINFVPVPAEENSV